MKYYQIRNKKLNEIHRYSKVKKEIMDGKEENNNKERCEEETSAD